MNVVAAQGRKLQSCHKAANAAFSQFRQAAELGATVAASSSQDVINITIECEESDIITDDNSGVKYYANFSALLMKPKTHEVNVKGPERDTRPEAVKDSEALGKAFQVEGELGVKRVAQLLERKTWTRAEINNADESTLEGLLDLRSNSNLKQEKLIPPGEGWTRFNDEMLWDVRSKVYFVQTGKQAGKYLMRNDKTLEFRQVNPPHAGVEHPIAARAGAASTIRKGAKMERTVILPELPKIARLALKFPLSFVDSPASAFALFQGIRSAEAADWCAKNFHTRLIPVLAAKIHNWETKELQDALGGVLADLDSEVLRSSQAFSACSAIVALLLGDRIVISGVGQVRATLLFEDGTSRQLMACPCDPGSAPERERVETARGLIHGGLVHRTLEDLGEAERILRARHVFEVLQMEAGGPADEKQVRTAYRKLALRVHPDKIQEESGKEAFSKAFARLESAKEAVEALLTHDAEACRELHRVLRFEVLTRAGAAELLGADGGPSTDTACVAEDAEKACKKQIKKLEKMEGIADDYPFAVALCKEAVETLRRPNSAEALPRSEALLRTGLPCTRAIGARDLRFPSPLVLMKPENASWIVSSRCRLALLCGATAALPDAKLVSSTAKVKGMPKASAMRWCLDADPAASTAGALCIGFDVRRPGARAGSEGGPAAKRSRTGPAGQQKAGSVFVRHILLRHQQLRTVDPLARREGAAKGPGEAESAALAALEKLLACPSLFAKVCRELSDCQSADQPGNLTGHLGWIARGEQEVALEEVAFALEPNDFGDIVNTSRGVHIIQRLG
eukprot:TRINITY_DN22978_c0_g1_i1.p2 TRINITY_DN22978_c0_g1~~TRINITY_DN22978_c0_g1_i1.p2  ORF type:complete len:825 (+),score=180.66 TRINITY_DN22978_c0_g1_i1:84-2477(+)